MNISAPILIYGDNISTDDIIPGPFLHLNDPRALAAHAFSGIDPLFPEKAKHGVILVVGSNFGCGSSREQAVICLQYSGVKAIIASSFARIFYRNAINQGLCIFETGEESLECTKGDVLSIDTIQGIIINTTQKKQSSFTPLPAFILDIIEHGGLLPWIDKNREKLS